MEILNPYPDFQWKSIRLFTYDCSLILERDIKSVKMRRDADAEYCLNADYIVSFELLNINTNAWRLHKIIVPKGMYTDLASVPRIARRVVGRVGPHLEASIVHDFLYIAWQDIEGRGARKEDRKFADEVLLAGMKAANVNRFQRTVIYNAVRAFGWGTYKRRDEMRYRV